MVRRSYHLSTALVLACSLTLVLASCGPQAEQEAIDGELLDDAKDPAMTGALEDQILVDPDLAGKNGQNSALSASAPGDGAVPPVGEEGAGAEERARAAVAEARAAAGEGGLLAAPKPVAMEDGDCKSCGRGGATLGAAAESQAVGRGKGTCDDKLTYDMRWAARLSPEMPLYPKASVKEAAGVEAGLCDIRAVTFVTGASVKQVADFYYTKAKRGGYSAEYVMRGGDHVMGGTREVDDGAFVLFFRPVKGGTEVDMVANNGR